MNHTGTRICPADCNAAKTSSKPHTASEPKAKEHGDVVVKVLCVGIVHLHGQLLRNILFLLFGLMSLLQGNLSGFKAFELRACARNRNGKRRHGFGTAQEVKKSSVINVRARTVTGCDDYYDCIEG